MSPLAGLFLAGNHYPSAVRAGPHHGGPYGPRWCAHLYVSVFVKATTKGMFSLQPLHGRRLFLRTMTRLFWQRVSIAPILKCSAFIESGNFHLPRLTAKSYSQLPWNFSAERESRRRRTTQRHRSQQSQQCRRLESEIRTSIISCRQKLESTGS
jgi:hypothetical protein